MGTAAATVAAAAIGYLLGTAPSADVASALSRRRDPDRPAVRAAGSGNPGALNTMHVLGRGWGVAVMLADIAKGAGAAAVGAALGSGTAAAAGATAAVVGHVVPVWTRGRGGKGVATYAGGALTIVPAAVPAALLAGALALVGTRRARHAAAAAAVTLVGAAALWWITGWANAWGPDAGAATFMFAAAGAAIVVSRFAWSAKPAVSSKP